MGALAVRKLADKSCGSRVARFDPVTGQRRLVNPDTPGDEHEPWPSAGVAFEGDPPDAMTVPARYVAAAVLEGWATVAGSRTVVRPAGRTQDMPASGQTGSPHTFWHCDEVVFHMVDGDYRYRVARQPDKYAAGDVLEVNAAKGMVRVQVDPEQPVTPEVYAAGRTVVSWGYRLERIFDG